MDINCNEIWNLLVRLITHELLNVNFEEKTVDIEQTHKNRVISIFSCSHIPSQ